MSRKSKRLTDMGGKPGMAGKATTIVMVMGLALAVAAGPVLASTHDDELADNPQGYPISESKFYGTVENLPQGNIGTWIVNGRAITVTRDTRIKEKYGTATAGSFVEIKGNNTGTTFIAYKVEVKRSRKK